MRDNVNKTSCVNKGSNWWLKKKICCIHKDCALLRVSKMTQSVAHKRQSKYYFLHSTSSWSACIYCQQRQCASAVTCTMTGVQTAYLDTGARTCWMDYRVASFSGQRTMTCHLLRACIADILDLSCCQQTGHFPRCFDWSCVYRDWYSSRMLWL